MKVAILGGGIAGLALGWNLRQQGIDFALYEKGSQAGGWIQTSQAEGFIFEQGPHSCRTRGAGRATLELIEQLGLEGEVIAASPNARKRFVYTQGSFKKVPVCPVSLLFSPWNTKILKALWNDWRTPQGDGKDESIYDFVSRRLSPQVAEELFDPFTTGIFAGDIRQLSAQACFPFLTGLEQKHGGLLRGMWAQRKKKKGEEGSPFVQKMLKTPLFSFRKGMQTLTDALQERLKGEIQFNKEAVGVSKAGVGWEMTFADGTKAFADRLFVAIPAKNAAKLLVPELSQIPFASLNVVNLGYDHPVLPRDGFGYLIPSQEKDPIMGVIWDSSVFPEQNRNPNETRLTVMLRPSEKEPLEVAQTALARQLKITTFPAASRVTQANAAIPQYTVGHLARLQGIEAALPPSIKLLGSSYRTLSVNECIAEALTL